MKRSDLYKKVWSTPMTKLAAELGISDVGLAKACLRHAVPVPHRGYWAKLRAGQRPKQAPFPTPELDIEVQFATRNREVVARRRKDEEHQAAMLQEAAPFAQNLPPISFANNLEKAQPLVTATRRYCDKLPGLIKKWKGHGLWHASNPSEWPASEQHGRYSLLEKGCLDITASLASMDWVLRFHATILGALTAGGMKIVRLEEKSEPRARSVASHIVEAHFEGEKLAIRFFEGYKRIRLSPQEFAARKKETSWASEYETKPSGNFTFAISGTERDARKEWKGTSEKLEGQVDEIVRTVFQLACLQPQLRAEREAREAEERRVEELEARMLERQSARAEQVKQAFLIMDANKRVSQLRVFLDRLEEQGPSLRKPFNERLAVWVQVVRRELSLRNPADEILEDCLSVQSWETWPPAWWPEEPDQAT